MDKAKAREPVVVTLVGHLTRDDLAARLAVAETSLVDGERVPLIVDATAMTGYASEARSEFVHWNDRCRGRIARVAIVTQNTFWHVVISAMSLASRQEMKPFRTLEEARAWSTAAPPAGKKAANG